MKIFISFDGSKSHDRRVIEDTTKNTEEQIAVLNALREVPPNQRECLVLHFVEGFKYKEIAVTLRISEDAVRKRIARGKEVFKNAYNGGESHEL